MPEDLDTDAATDVDDLDADTGAGDDTNDDVSTGAADQAKPAAAKAAKKAPDVPRLDGKFDQARFESTILRVREEARAAKEEAQSLKDSHAETMKKIAAAFGLGEEEKPDPDKLAADLAASKAEERQRRTEMQVLRLAPNLEADADALLDSTSFLKTIRDLDPADGSFRDDVEDAIKAFIGKNARYRATKVSAASDEAADKTTTKTEKRPAGRSGADMSGQGGRDRQVTQAELESMSPREIVAAREAGRLRNLLAGT